VTWYILLIRIVNGVQGETSYETVSDVEMNYLVDEVRRHKRMCTLSNRGINYSLAKVERVQYVPCEIILSFMKGRDDHDDPDDDDNGDNNKVRLFFARFEGVWRNGYIAALMPNLGARWR